MLQDINNAASDVIQAKGNEVLREENKNQNS